MLNVYRWNLVYDMTVENERHVDLTYELKLIVPIDQHLTTVYYYHKIQ